MSDRRLIEQHARIMATDMHVHLACGGDDAPDAMAAVEACLEWLRDVDRRLTRFDEASELCHSDWYGRAAVRHLAEDEPLLAVLGASGVGSFGAEEHTGHNDYARRDD